MSRSFWILLGSICLFQVIQYTVGQRFEWLQVKDRLSWKQGFRRNQYELFLQFTDGRMASYHFYANYSRYQVNDLLVKLFEDTAFVGIMEDDRMIYYRSSQIEKMESHRVLVKPGKRGVF